ncbi:MAG TPA: hypothetical protein PLO89_12205 [Spirochaetota bacterium]|nr:hypothetical protein [Spirochaetota bacterium]
MSDNEQGFDKKSKEMFDDFYRKIEGRIGELQDELKENFIPQTEEKLRKNVFMTVLISFGVGFIVGIIVMLFGSLRGKRR